MSNPEDAVTHETFETKVTTALSEATRSEDGKLEFKEGTSEEVVYAATTEQRRRDTQAEYTKTKQNNAALKAEKDELMTQLDSDVKLDLTLDQEEELDELKFSDPDKWRSKMNFYETEAQAKHTKQVDERLKEVSAKGTETAELERRKQVLQDFQAANPGLALDDDVIANDVPPRISKRLQENEVTFEEFLQEVHNYLKTGKVVNKTDETMGQPNLSKAGGSDTPSDEAVEHESVKTYDTEVY